MTRNSEKGAAPLLILLLVVGLIAFTAISYTAPFKNNMLSALFPKDQSQAAVPGGVVELSVLPVQQNVDPGKTFKVDITIDTHGLSATAAQIQLNFDSQYVKATEIVNSGYFPQTLMAGTISNGTATISVGAAPTSPLNGRGTVATVTFNALTTPTEAADFILDFTNTQVSAIGIPEDVAGTLNPATVKIGSVASIAPTTTPRPTVSPSPVATPTPVSSPTPVASSNSNSVTLEAETMSLVANSQALQVFSDTQASAGKGMVFFSNATSTGTFNTATTLTRFNVRARGDLCKGSPVMALKIDNVQVARKGTAVSSLGWVDYLYNKTITPGTHTFSVTFANDFIRTKGAPCDRNLRIDKITFQ